MLTIELWKRSVTYVHFPEPIDYFLAISGSILTIPVDIILSPIEIIGLVLYKIFEK